MTPGSIQDRPTNVKTMSTFFSEILLKKTYQSSPKWPRSPKDIQTIEILKTMREDEDIHAQQAVDNGGEELQIPAKKIMKYTAKVMTSTSTHI